MRVTYPGHLFVIATIALLFAMAASRCSAAEIWLSATEPPWRVVNGWPANDYMDLFKADAPWPRAASNVKVFELSKRFVMESSDAQLSEVISALRRHHIKLSVQGTPLLATQHCGLGVEGHGLANDMVTWALKLKRLGADLAYIRMDEPLWYGHEWNGAPGIVACHTSIDEIARQAAIKLMPIRQIYPRVVIGDIEPLGVPANRDAEWASAISQWINAYTNAMGEPLGLFHLDIVWVRPSWRAEFTNIVSILRSDNVPIGITYDGNRSDQSDAAWLDNAQSHFELIEGKLNMRPDQAVFQSWMDFPRAMLPERDHDTLTNLVLRYAAWQAQAK